MPLTPEQLGMDIPEEMLNEPLDELLYRGTIRTAELTDQAGSHDCPFCHGYEPSLHPFDLALRPGDDSDVVLKPALGMSLPGYLLAVTKEHTTSFAQLGSDRLQQVDAYMTGIEAELAQVDVFGEYFRFEHGSDNVKECGVGSGACIDHAHQHMVPAPGVAEVIRDELPWEELDGFESLAELQGIPYVYLGFEGGHYAIKNPALPSQWVRRKIAEYYGQDDWDWGIEYGKGNLFITLAALGHREKAGVFALRHIVRG